ncbi:MAG: hypothetical protein CM15mP49_22790 [Actinomycetota bacterium]|nr:MAG: hypothetical protein CM15mP49_22790 [Actinomycetota bacterium]
MDVTEAVYKRKSIRGFLSTPVLDDELESLLNKAAAPRLGQCATMEDIRYQRLENG